MTTRRSFLKLTGAGLLALYVSRHGKFVLQALAQPIPGGTLDPLSVPKYQAPMLIPPVMPKSGKVKQMMGKKIDYYEISVRQFNQRILPLFDTNGAPLNKTPVWGYGSVDGSGSKNPLLLHNAPSLTVEADWTRPVRIKWINELVDANGDYLPHLLPVDPTLHWANPPGGTDGRDMRPNFDGKTYVPLADFTDPESEYTQYTGPVPIVTHVHGAVGVGDESDGYAEAWFLPAAVNIPAGYATKGTWYDYFAAKAFNGYGETWGPGYATFQYPNDNRASTIWYHDHGLGMTRLNVYAGPAGFYLIRGGPDDIVLDSQTNKPAILPGPAPKDGDKFPPNKTYYEIPIAIQDRSFNTDGTLFYPDTREFFDGIVEPFIPGDASFEGFSPIWQPEFFGNMMMVNGNTWPFQTVEQVRYRFRFLNGCQSRFLILDFNDIPDVQVWQIGNDGGFLAAPVNITADHGNRLLMGLAERADVIVDFANVPVGNYVLGNVGPDEPFGGGVPVIPPAVPNEEAGEFAAADPDSTGQIMQFQVVPAVAPDPSTDPQFLVLPTPVALPATPITRKLALIEKMGMGLDAAGNQLEGPVEALLGNVDADGNAVEALWMDPVTENPDVGATEVWEFYNTTGDAHPMHIHEIVFEVVNREELETDANGEVVQPIVLTGNITLAEPWETGFKDTVIAYPGQVTRVKAQFNTPGQFVWHCHIVEHEDNEMMRPYRIGPADPAAPGSM